MRFLGWLMVAGCGLALMAADVTKGNFGAAKQDEPETKAEAKPERKAEPKSNSNAKAKAKSPSYPFHGTLDSVDANGKTITLRGKQKNRVIIVSPATRIKKQEAAADLRQGVPGERVSGLVRKNAEGKEEAITVRFGPKTAGK